MLLCYEIMSRKDLHDAQLIHVYDHQDKWRNQRQAHEDREKIKLRGRISILLKGYCLYILEAGENQVVEDENTGVLNGEESQRL